MQIVDFWVIIIFMNIQVFIILEKPHIFIESMKKFDFKKTVWIQGRILSQFRDDCKVCPMQHLCVRATGLWQSPLEYVLTCKGFKLMETEEMRLGKEFHEEEMLAIPTINDIGYNKYLDWYFASKKILLSEVGVCSRLYGLRGKIDILYIHPDFKKKKLDILIKELKLVFNKKYIPQVGAYALILSDPEAEIVFKWQTKKGEKVIGQRIFPVVDLFHRNIAIEIMTEDGRIWKKDFMVNNKLTKWGSGINMLVRRLAKKKRKLHKFGLYLIEELDKNVKHKQLFLGKRKILVKSKPKVKMK